MMRISPISLRIWETRLEKLNLSTHNQRKDPELQKIVTVIKNPKAKTF